MQKISLIIIQFIHIIFLIFAYFHFKESLYFIFLIAAISFSIFICLEEDDLWCEFGLVLCACGIVSGVFIGFINSYSFLYILLIMLVYSLLGSVLFSFTNIVRWIMLKDL